MIQAHNKILGELILFSLCYLFLMEFTEFPAGDLHSGTFAPTCHCFLKNNILETVCASYVAWFIGLRQI
jgi:hypothetical protein